MYRSVIFVSLLLVIPSVFAQEPPPPPDKTWSGDFGAGLSLTRGNSDTQNLNLTANASQRLNARNLMKYDAFYLRADSNGELTVDRTLFGARDEYTVSP